MRNHQARTRAHARACRRYIEQLLIARGAFKALAIGAWLRRFNAEMAAIVPE